ncbi:MAG: ABC transporter ATP-binding protein [Dehalococcoidia bacterium]|nr:putative ABC transporter ATP-binding protein [Chloroflexota bacterium]MBT9162509.1 putative ABC transporter ATP-binding protein [Chloroflexota bacterium]
MKEDLKEALRLMFSQRESESEKVHLADLKRLLPYARRRWKTILVGFILLIITALIPLPIPYLTMMVIDDVLLGDQDARLFVLLILIMVGLHIGEMIFSSITDYLFAVINQTVLADIQKDLFSRILRLPFSFFNESQTGYLLSRMGEVSALSTIFSNALIMQLIGFVQFIFILVMLFYLNWQLTLVALLTLPILFVVLKYSSRGILPVSEELMESAAEISSHMEESFSGIEVIKSFGTEARASEGLTQKLNIFVRKGILESMIFTIFSQGTTLIFALSLLLILVVSGFQIMAGVFTIGGYLAFVGYVGMLYAPIASIASFGMTLQPILVALSRVLEFFKLTSEHEGRGDETLNYISGKIEFNGVSFSYDGNKKAVDNVTFAIRPGEKVAIVGPNGAGKSTLIQLLLGLQLPQEGSILIDGQDITKVKLSSLRERIGIISQNIFLFNDTVKNNIVYSDPDISDQEIEQVIKNLGITDFIKNLPQGLNTVIGERGVKLSGGEKQLLAFIRTTLKKPPILVLDEATSAIDQTTEKKIEEIIKSQYQQNAVIIIAHKSELIKIADKRVILDKGEIVRIEDQN